MAYPIGIQSWCFRKFKDNAEVARLVTACGADRIELCAVHCDFRKPELWPAAIDAYRKAGVSILGTGVNGLAGQGEEDRPLFEFLSAAGAAFMSVDFPIAAIPGNLRAADRLAERFGVKLGIHNHGGRHWLGCAQAIDWVFQQTSERVGLWMDTAWALHAHEDPVEWVKRFGKRLHGVHIKDFTFDTQGGFKDVVAGTGLLKLKDLLKAMQDAGYAGSVVIEYEADVDNPAPALTGCVQAVRAAMA